MREKDNSTSPKKRRKLVLTAPIDERIDCPQCGALLYKVLYKSSGSIIEIKCRRCGTVHRGI